jgi:hypothetical protein
MKNESKFSLRDKNWEIRERNHERDNTQPVPPQTPTLHIPTQLSPSYKLYISPAALRD